MKAYTVAEYGPDARFEATEVPTPSPGPGEVLIEIKASSLNPVDHLLLTNDIGLNPEVPGILHMDVSGVITAIGEGVSSFQVGDEVYGCAGGLKGPAGNLQGTLAEYISADADLIAVKPSSLSFAEAAALPLVSITAYEALIDRCGLKTSDHVLIHGAVGGVGHIAIQIAKIIGATVSTTASGGTKAEIAKGFSPDHLINYREQSVSDYVASLTGGAGFDIVFDTVGGPNLDASFEATKASGQVATVIGMNTHDLTPMHMKGLSLHLIFMLLPMITGQGRAHHGEILTQIAQWVDAGQLKPLINEQRFCFDQANEAHALFASGQHIGKIVLEA